MRAFNFLRMLFADFVLLGVDMPFVGAPPIGVIPCDAKRLQQRLQLQKDRILPAPEDVGQYRPTVVIDRLPQPPWLRFLPHVTLHLIQF